VNDTLKNATPGKQCSAQFGFLAAYRGDASLSRCSSVLIVKPFGLFIGVRSLRLREICQP
jgi:hypothetical protein